MYAASVGGLRCLVNDVSQSSHTARDDLTWSGRRMETINVTNDILNSLCQIADCLEHPTH